jgi:general secretion pathway protein F
MGWIPGVGRIGSYFRLANFADLLAVLLENGVPLPDGLRLSADATGSAALRASASRLAEAVERGNRFGEHTATKAAFPPFLQWVVCQAAEGANAVRLLRHAGTFYRRRAYSLANWFKAIFPVFATVVIGGGVAAFYLFSLFGPLASFWIDLGTE